MVLRCADVKEYLPYLAAIPIGWLVLKEFYWMGGLFWILN